MRDCIVPLSVALEQSACQCSTIEEFADFTAEHEMAIRISPNDYELLIGHSV